MDDGNDCTGREEGTEMSAIEELIKRQAQLDALTDVYIVGGNLSQLAAAELAALQAELAFFHGAFPSASKNYADMIKRQKA